jgi:hypothetical protein
MTPPRQQRCRQAGLAAAAAAMVLPPDLLARVLGMLPFNHQHGGQQALA